MHRHSRRNYLVLRGEACPFAEESYGMRDVLRPISDAQSDRTGDDALGNNFIDNRSQLQQPVASSSPPGDLQRNS